MNDTNNQQEVAVRESATADQALATAVSKAELDQQITTARAFPRSLKKFLNECRDMALLTEKIAGECFYSLPRKEQGVTKMINGPSARLAEIVVSAWGNCRVGARVVDVGREYVTCQGVFHDMERNVSVTIETQRRITNKEGRRFSADMIGVTANACSSIALRNAVFKGIPKAFWNDIYEDCRKAATGDVKTLANRRSEALLRLQKLGATQDMVLKVLGVNGIEDIGIDELSTLQGLFNAVKSEEMTIEEAFAPAEADKPAASKADAAKDALKRSAAHSAPPPPADAPVDKATGEIKQSLPTAASVPIPTAINRLRGCRTLAALSMAMGEFKSDWKSIGKDVPLDIEAVYTECKEALADKAADI